MTLEEAINHCDEVIKDETSCGCFACADEHRQLKEWLRELKRYREKVKEITQDNVNFIKQSDNNIK